MHTKPRTWLFIATLFTIAPVRGKNKFPSIDQQGNEIWYYSYDNILVRNNKEQTTDTWRKRWISASLCWVWRRQWQPTPVLLPGKSHGWKSLVSRSPWGREESDTTEWLHFHFSLSCIGGNGSPLQCSCLENPRDGGSSWAAVYGVAESDTTEVT